MKKQPPIQGLVLHLPLENLDSDGEIQQLQTIQETYPSVTKQSLNQLDCDPSIFRDSSKFKYFFLLPDTPLDVDTIVNYQGINGN